MYALRACDHASGHFRATAADPSWDPVTGIRIPNGFFFLLGLVLKSEGPAERPLPAPAAASATTFIIAIVPSTVNKYPEQKGTHEHTGYRVRRESVDTPQVEVEP